MSFDAHKNFAYATVATAPSPPATGTSLVVAASLGGRFPTPPFNATVWPAGAQPTADNAEIVRVTAITTDTFTITRQAEGSSARAIGVGDQIAATITKQTLTDIEAGAAPTVTLRRGSGLGNYSSPGGTYIDVDGTNLAYTVTVPVGYMLTIVCAFTMNPGAASVTTDFALTDVTTLLVEGQVNTGSGGGTQGHSLSYVFTGDGAQHTFKLRWKSNGAPAILNSSATLSPVMAFTLQRAN